MRVMCDGSQSCLVSLWTSSLLFSPTLVTPPPPPPVVPRCCIALPHGCRWCWCWCHHRLPASPAGVPQQRRHFPLGSDWLADRLTDGQTDRQTDWRRAAGASLHPSSCLSIRPWLLPPPAASSCLPLLASNWRTAPAAAHPSAAAEAEAHTISFSLSLSLPPPPLLSPADSPCMDAPRIGML